MWSGIDKRRFPRVHFQCHVVVRRKDHPESFSTQTENIGAGGLCAILDKGLELFTEVVVEVTLPDSPDLLVNDGKVVWVVKEAGSQNRFDTGIEFVELPAEQKTRIEQIVEKIFSGSYKTSGNRQR